MTQPKHPDLVQALISLQPLAQHGSLSVRLQVSGQEWDLHYGDPSYALESHNLGLWAYGYIDSDCTLVDLSIVADELLTGIDDAYEAALESVREDYVP
jgi:hypothetical protein